MPRGGLVRGVHPLRWPRRTFFCCCRVGSLGLDLVLGELSNVNTGTLKLGPVFNAGCMSALCWVWSDRAQHWGSLFLLFNQKKRPQK